MTDLTGKVAIVTGGAKGIGAAVVRRLAEDGAAVVIADIDEEAGRAVAAETGARLVRCDVASEADILALLAYVDREFGRLDIIVNDAAVQLNKPLLETSTEEFSRVLAINLTGSFVMMREGAKYMIGKGIRGAIVNFSSTFAVVGSPGYLAYHASKGGVSSMTRAAAIALIPHGIRVNAVAPGTTDTPGLHDGARDTGDEQAAMESFLRLQPLGRFGRPSDIASVVRFLVDDESGYICGATIMADGGYTIV